MTALRTVIVGVDGSDASRDALALGQLLAGPRGRLLVVHAHPYKSLSSLMGPGEFEGLLRETAESIFAHAREVLDDATDRELRLVEQRSPADGLGSLAADLGAALIVVGSSGRSRLERVLAGSVAEDLLSGAPVAVAVAPRGFADDSRAADATVGCAYDGSPESEVALGLATEFAQALNARLRVISVHQRIAFGGQVSLSAVGYSSVNDAVREALRQRLSQARSAVPDGVSAEGRLLDGDPAEALIGESETLDLLVAGSRGYGPVRAVLLGSVSRALVRDAACPVVVSPRLSDQTSTGGGRRLMPCPARALRVGVRLGERPDLLDALLDIPEIELVAVARDRPEADAPPPSGLPRDLFGWWPERGPGAVERHEEAIARWFRARAVEFVVAAGWSGC